MKDCDQIVNELNESCKKWKHYLSNPQINENLLLEANESIIDLKRKAGREKEANVGKIMNRKLLTFKMNTEKSTQSSIGDLSLNIAFPSKL